MALKQCRLLPPSVCCPRCSQPFTVAAEVRVACRIACTPACSLAFFVKQVAKAALKAEQISWMHREC